MIEQMEKCSHVWIYDHTEHDTTYMRCPYCQMVRIVMPGEVVARLNHPQKVKQLGENNNDNY